MNRILTSCACAFVLAGCSWSRAHPQGVVPSPFISRLNCHQKAIVKSARAQLEKGINYDQSYYSIPYPNGDVPADRGACVDLVIRALRADGQDLQELVHEDAKKCAYPRISKGSLDTNIDHRRVPNLIRFLARHGKTLTNSTGKDELIQWQPGDIVMFQFSSIPDHIGIVSDQINGSGVPLVIHNMGGVKEEDVLGEWRVVGHFRYPT